MNQIRVRDVIADDDTTFEVHKLEHIKDKQSGEAGSGLMMRLQCRDEEDKNHWVRCINTEVKLLRNTTKNIRNLGFLNRLRNGVMITKINPIKLLTKKRG